MTRHQPLGNNKQTTTKSFYESKMKKKSKCGNFFFKFTPKIEIDFLSLELSFTKQNFGPKKSELVFYLLQYVIESLQKIVFN